MAEIYLDVDVALTAVPLNTLPLLDDTDFKTFETGVVYNSAGMDLRWNFITSAGVRTCTAVTPTTSGDYDLVNHGDAMYSLEMPASGGASANNDTEGTGWFTGVITGVLPFCGPRICFRAAAINDSLCDAGATGLLAPTTAGRTLDVSSAGNAGIDLDNIQLTNGADIVGITASGTLTGTHSTTTADLGTNAPARTIVNKWLRIPTRDVSALISAYNTGTGVATFSPATAETLTNGDQWYVADSPNSPTDVALMQKVDVRAVEGVATGEITGAAATGTLSTTQATSNLTGYANDQLIGRVIIWLSGDCEGEATDITDYASASGLLTFTALTTAPANTDLFKIV